MQNATRSRHMNAEPTFNTAKGMHLLNSWYMCRMLRYVIQSSSNATRQAFVINIARAAIYVWIIFESRSPRCFLSYSHLIMVHLTLVFRRYFTGSGTISSYFSVSEVAHEFLWIGYGIYPKQRNNKTCSIIRSLRILYGFRPRYKITQWLPLLYADKYLAEFTRKYPENCCPTCLISHWCHGCWN